MTLDQIQTIKGNRSSKPYGTQLWMLPM